MIERHGHRLLTSLVGDSLLEPFWPTGTGCARGFFGGLDACWLMRTLALGMLIVYKQERGRQLFIYFYFRKSDCTGGCG